MRDVAATAPFTDNTDFGSIIDSVYSEFDVEQTIDNYSILQEVNMNSMLVDDIIVLRQWLYPEWDGKKVGDIQDPVNQFSLNTTKTALTSILNTRMIYDNAIFLIPYKHVFGWKKTRIKCLLINEKMYFLSIGTNIQSFGLRPDSNTNITTLLNIIIRGNYTNNRIYCAKNNITPINNIESINELRTLNMKYEDIKLSKFILTIDINVINNTTYQDIILNEDLITIIEGETINITDNDDRNMISKYKNFWANFNKKNYHEYMSINDYTIITYEDLYADFMTGIKCIEISGNVFTLLCTETRIQDIIKPSLSVEGDAKITGDLMVTNTSTGENYVSIDPDNKYVGIGTDERFINYSDMSYTTTSGAYNSKHNFHNYGSSYPIAAFERLAENANDTSNNDISKNDPRYFSTYTAITAKRMSNLYTFQEMDFYATELQKTIPDTDKVTHMRYGSDVSYEIRDKTDRTVEIGNVQMVIDKIDENNNLRGGFSIQVNDPGGEDRTFENSRRNLMYLDNDSQLFVQKINLNGGGLTTDNNSTNLFWNGKQVVTKD